MKQFKQRHKRRARLYTVGFIGPHRQKIIQIHRERVIREANARLVRDIEQLRRQEKRAKKQSKRRRKQDKQLQQQLKAVRFDESSNQVIDFIWVQQAVESPHPEESQESMPSKKSKRSKKKT